MQKAEPEAFNRKERKGRKEFSFSALFALLSVRVAQFREDFPDAVYSLFPSVHSFDVRCSIFLLSRHLPSSIRYLPSSLVAALPRCDLCG